MKVLPSCVAILAILWSCADARSPSGGDTPAVGHEEECGDCSRSGGNPHRGSDVIVRGDAKAFPCPVAGDISPCVCRVLPEGLEMDCSDVTSEEELERIFLKDFPVTEFYSFYMTENSGVTSLQADVFNLVTFENITLTYSNIALVSTYALEPSVDTLKRISIDGGSLTENTFPLHLEIYSKLEDVYLQNQQFTWLPTFSSTTLKGLSFYESLITELKPGTFDELPNIDHIGMYFNKLSSVDPGAFTLTTEAEEVDIWLQGNQITVIHPDAFRLHNGRSIINLSDNKLSVVHPAAFVLPSKTDSLQVSLNLVDNMLTTLDEEAFKELFDYLTAISIRGNPFDCGCDIAWIIQNPNYVDKITSGDCADGTPIDSLDPDFYEQYC